MDTIGGLRVVALITASCSSDCESPFTVLGSVQSSPTRIQPSITQRYLLAGWCIIAWLHQG